MNRNSGNVSKTKKLISGVSNNSKPNRKSFQKLSETSSLSSNRNSSAHSEEDVRIGCVYLRSQVTNNATQEEKEQAIKKLQGQVKELRQKLRVLEESVESKDYSLGTIAREKDRAVGEIRRLEKSNKQLRQQLNDERNYYLEEKEKFCEEMTKYKKKLQEVKLTVTDKKQANLGTSKQSLINQSLKWHLNKDKGDFEESKTTTEIYNSKSQKMYGVNDKKLLQVSSISFSDSQIRKQSADSFHLYVGDDISLQMAALRTENAKLRSIICERDERNYELCLRFLRMKHYKNDIRNRFQDLENEYLQVITNLMDKIDEARQEFNFIIDQKFKKPIHSTNAMYLQMVQRNSRMAFENASLRLENQCLKKELNKYMNNASELERKVDRPSTANELRSKTIIANPDENAKLKRIKKNVNFNEIRTIYERDFHLKNSDTDSNYMSKTSTTVPSNGSLGDLKSNESIIDGEKNSKNKNQHDFQANSLPDEILNKIFKRVDTSSCQTIDTEPSKRATKTDTSKDGTTDEVLGTGPSENEVPPPSPEKKIIGEIMKKKAQSHPIIVEHDSKKVTESSSPSESRESVHIHMKTASSSGYCNLLDGREDIPPRRPGKPEDTRMFKNRLKNRLRNPSSLDRKPEDDHSDNPTRRFGHSGRRRSARQDRHSSSKDSKGRLKQFRDGCGLEEKLEVSDTELPPPVLDETKVQTEVTERAKPINQKLFLMESEDEHIGRGLGMKPLNPAVGSRSRSSNKLSLQDELLEVTRHHQKTDKSVWKTEIKEQTVPLESLSKLNKKEEESLEINFQFNKPTSPKVLEETTESTQDRNVTHSRKTEASKRFSQRLVSTTPELLRSILTESQLGNFQMAPVIVGHATTEINPNLSYGDGNEIFLKLIIPNSKVGSNFLDNADAVEKEEKETSRSALSPLCPTKSSNLAETCSSDMQLHVSSLPSNSTVEMVDSAALNDRSNIMMRTLSAPGLLESNWLDPYTICEMRDCSTNT